jgi:hypothetical protein
VLAGFGKRGLPFRLVNRIALPAVLEPAFGIPGDAADGDTHGDHTRHHTASI